MLQHVVLKSSFNLQGQSGVSRHAALCNINMNEMVAFFLIHADYTMEMARLNVLSIHLHGGYVQYETCQNGVLAERFPSALYSGGDDVKGGTTVLSYTHNVCPCTRFATPCKREAGILHFMHAILRIDRK